MSINKTNIQWTRLPCQVCNGAGTGEWESSTDCQACGGTGYRQGYTANPIRFRDRETGEAITWAKVIHEMLTSKKLSGCAVFLGDMTDLFGEWVPDAMLDRIFAVMALRPALSNARERCGQTANSSGHGARCPTSGWA